MANKLDNVSVGTLLYDHAYRRVHVVVKVVKVDLYNATLFSCIILHYTGEQPDGLANVGTCILVSSEDPISVLDPDSGFDRIFL